MARIPRLRHLQSLLAAVLVFGLGYMVWQPLAVCLLLHLLLREPLPFDSFAEWRDFILAVGVLGTPVGAAWHYMRRLPKGSLRDWIHYTLPAVSFLTLLFADQFNATGFPKFFALVLLTGGLVGATWLGLQTLVRRLGRASFAA